jgi:ATP-dependent RNA helicase DDX54/DBP10
MLAQKRKRRDPDDNYSSNISVPPNQVFSDSDIDISSALTGKKKAKITPAAREDSDDDLQNFLHESISRRDIKNGTEIVKKTKGKGKIAKGEVGGGSFQSMGQAIVFDVIARRRD